MEPGKSEAAEEAGDQPKRLRIYLLGPPFIRWDGEALNIPRRQVRALLYYLASDLDVVPYEYLRFLFWPDVPDATTRRYLSHLLTHLRSALSDQRLLISTTDHVQLNPKIVWSDIETFRQLITNPETENRVECLQQAVELYRGPFLHGFNTAGGQEFDNWVEQKCYFVDQLYLKALVSLIDDHTNEENFDSAIFYAQLYLEMDGLAEDVHLRLMELYTRVGKRNLAIDQFRHCARVLEQEFGVSPNPEIQATYHSAMYGNIATPPTATKTQPPITSWTKQSSAAIGNVQAFEQIKQAFWKAHDGRGAVVSISGEMGIGKSHLLREFTQYVSGETQVLIGTCYPFTQMIPYYALIQTLRSIMDSDTQLTKIYRSPPADIAQYMSKMPDSDSVSLQLASKELDINYLPMVASLNKTLLRMASGPNPVLLTFDDVHWADRATLDWLVHISEQLGKKRLLILISYCCKATGHMAEFRHQLVRVGSLCCEILLAGMDTPEVLGLVRQATGQFEGDFALAEQIQRITGGNPLLILELINGFAMSGSSPKDLVILDTLPLPATVYASVLARIERLGAMARRVVEACSLLEPPFDFDQVCLASGCSELEVMDALDELVARHLLVDEHPVYRFYHALMPLIIREDMSPIRREILSRRATNRQS